MMALLVTAMTRTLRKEPTYGQFEGTFQYRQKKTPYAVTQPRNLVTLVDSQTGGQADVSAVLARSPANGPWCLHAARANIHCPSQWVAVKEGLSSMPSLARAHLARFDKLHEKKQSLQRRQQRVSKPRAFCGAVGTRRGQPRWRRIHLKQTTRGNTAFQTSWTSSRRRSRSRKPWCRSCLI